MKETFLKLWWPVSIWWPIYYEDTPFTRETWTNLLATLPLVARPSLSFKYIFDDDDDDDGDDDDDKDVNDYDS